MQTRFSWTQPCCSACFWLLHGDPLVSSRLKQPAPETCVHCGGETRSGIYVRVDPADALHPTLTKDAA